MPPPVSYTHLDVYKRQPIRWVLVRDPRGGLEPQAFLCTDPQATGHANLTWFLQRWQGEGTCEAVSYTHLGVQKRQDQGSRQRTATRRWGSETDHFLAGNQSQERHCRQQADQTLIAGQ